MSLIHSEQNEYNPYEGCSESSVCDIIIIIRTEVLPFCYIYNDSGAKTSVLAFKILCRKFKSYLCIKNEAAAVFKIDVDINFSNVIRTAYTERNN